MAAVSAVVRRLPRRVVLAVGRRLGRLWGALDRRHLTIAVDNLRRAFPEWDETRVQATARDVYAHFGTVLLDLLWMEGRSAEDLLALADLEGVPTLGLPVVVMAISAEIADEGRLRARLLAAVGRVA